MTTPPADHPPLASMEAGPIMVLRRDELLRALRDTTGAYVALAPGYRVDAPPESADDDYTHAFFWSGDDPEKISGADSSVRLPGRDMRALATFISPVLICVKAAELYG